jgi:hypothetical protein
LAVTAKRLYAGLITSTSQITAYTVPAGKTVIVKQIAISNTDSVASHKISVFLAGVNIITNFSISASDTIILDLSQVLNAGEAIAIQADTANALTVFISGVEVS